MWPFRKTNLIVATPETAVVNQPIKLMGAYLSDAPRVIQYRVVGETVWRDLVALQADDGCWKGIGPRIQDRRWVKVDVREADQASATSRTASFLVQAPKPYEAIFQRQEAEREQYLRAGVRF